MNDPSQNTFGDSLYGSQLPEPKSPWRPFFIVIAIIALGLAGFFVFCIWLLVSEPAPIDEQVVTDQIRAEESSPADAFNEAKFELDSEAIGHIKLLFDAVLVTVNEENDAAFVKLVDVDRLFERIQQIGDFPVTRFNLATYKSQLRGDLDPPGGWDRYDLVSARSFDEGKLAIVYAFLWTGDEAMSFRAWVSLHNDGWKLFDWELLEHGLSKSEIYASLWSDEEERAANATNLAYTEINQAVDKGNDPDADPQEMLDLFASAQKRRALPEFQDDVYLRCGYALSSFGYYDEAMECYQRIQGSPPGMHWGMAVVHQQRQEYELALKATEQFENAIGFNPSTSDLKAEVLTELQRLPEAIVARKRLLDFHTDDYEAIWQLCLLLDDEQLPSVEKYLTNADDPAAAIARVARSAGYSDRPALVEMLINVQTKREKNSALAFWLRGKREFMEEEIEAAAELYFKAHEREANSEKQWQYLSDYLVQMVTLDKVAEAYERVPDKIKAFDYLTEGFDDYDSYLSNAQLESLLPLHKKAHPDEWSTHYYEGFLHADRGDNEKAAEAYGAAFERGAPDYAKYEYSCTLLELARVDDAYELVGAKADAEAFQELAYYCKNSKHEKQIQQLLELHKKHHPDDVWLVYFEAVLAQFQKDFDKADSLFAKVVDELGDESDAYRSRIYSRYLNDEYLSAIREIKPQDETFNYVVQLLTNDSRYEDLREVVAELRKVTPADPNLPIVEARVAWHAQKFEQVVSALTPWPEEGFGELSPWREFEFRNYLFRSLLRLNRQREATEAAKIFDENQYQSHLLVAMAHQKNIEEMRNEVANGKNYQFLYKDPDVGKIMFSDSMQSFRNEFPPSPDDHLSASTFVFLLYDEVPDWFTSIEPDSLPAEIVQVSALSISPADQEEIASAMRVSDSSGQMWMLTCGTTSLDTDEDDASGDAFKHKAWCAIGRFADEPSTAVEQQLVANMIDRGNCTGAYFPDEYRAFSQSEVFKKQVTDWIAGTYDLESGEYIGMYRETYDESKSKNMRLCRRRLSEFRRAFDDRGPDDSFLIQTELRCGELVEPLWIEVDRIERQSSNYFQYFGKSTSDSQLVPTFQKGSPVFLRKWKVLDWKFTKDGETTHAISP